MRSSRLTLGLLLLICTPLFSQHGKLTGDGRITGTIVNSDGEPVSQATVCTSISSPHSSSTSWGSAETDKDGRFELEQLPIREIWVFAEKQNAGCWTENSDSSQKILLTPQDPLAHVVLNVGPPAGELTIAVLDNVTGKPIQSSTVRTTQGNHTFINENLPTTTVRVRPDSDVMVQISASGYKTWYYIDPDDPSQPVLRLRPGETKTVDAYLDREPLHAATKH